MWPRDHTFHASEALLSASVFFRLAPLLGEAKTLSMLVNGAFLQVEASPVEVETVHGRGRNSQGSNRNPKIGPLIEQGESERSELPFVSDRPGTALQSCECQAIDLVTVERVSAIRAADGVKVAVALQLPNPALGDAQAFSRLPPRNLGRSHGRNYAVILRLVSSDIEPLYHMKPS
jgi:hypothetical protein